MIRDSSSYSRGSIYSIESAMAGASTSGGATTQDNDSFELSDLEQIDEQRYQGQGARRPSAYVDVFESR